MRTRLILLVAFLFTLMLSPAGVARAAQGESQYFPETGKTVSGKFLDYWRANGGLPTYGYPITEAQNEVNPENGGAYLTQWFERNRFELHPEYAGSENEVLLGLLGKDLNRARLNSDPAFVRVPAPPPSERPTTNRTYFTQTGHNLTASFYSYWQANGGLRRFGYPISEEHSEVSATDGKTYIVQWFERARFEHHPENQPPYDVLLGLLGNEIKLHKASPQFAWAVGGDYRPFPRGNVMAVDPNGNVYMDDEGNRKVLKYDNAGHYLGELALPDWSLDLIDMAADGAGNVYLAVTRFESQSSQSNWILKYDAAGQDRGRWQPPQLPGNYYGGGQMISLEAANDGTLYLGAQLYGDTYRIFKYGSDGSAKGAWGEGARSAVAYPYSIAADRQGHVYVSNPVERRISIFNSNGTYITAWTGSDSGNGVDSPDRLAVDAAGHVFATDPTNGRMMKIDSDGRVMVLEGAPGSGPSEYGRMEESARIKDVGVDGAGNVYVLDMANWRIQKLDNNLNYILEWGNDEPGKLFNPGGVAVDAANNIYVADSGNARIVKYDPQGNVIMQFGNRGTRDEQLAEPDGVAVDSQGNIFVVQGHYMSQIARPGVSKFDAQGHFLLRWGDLGEDHDGGLPGKFYNPDAIAVDGAGNVYVTDSGNYRVQKFDGYGNFLGQFGWRDGAPNRYIDPHGVAIDAAGNAYVSSYLPENSVIRKFSGRFDFLLEWSSYGSGPGQLDHAMGLALDAQGNLYIADRDNARIQKFDATGHFLAQWGSQGNAPSQFTQPNDVAVDSSGNAYVVDATNRLQKFTP